MLNKIYLQGDLPQSPAGEKPKQAATVILVRPSDDNELEILLACRHSGQSFMAGAFVFPGGQLEQADYSEDILPHLLVSADFHPQALLQDDTLAPHEARSFFVAAIRETFEEAGILLGGDESGNFINFNCNKTSARFTSYRNAINSSNFTFNEVVRKEKIFLYPEALIPYSHWITPQSTAKRFDTRFFLACLPQNQHPVSDSAELTELMWITPQNALRMQLSKEIRLMPPTLKTIIELAQFSGIDDLIATAKNRIIYPILPQEFEKGVKLPHDPEYSLKQHKRPANQNEPSRVIWEDGLWKAVFHKQT